jgi:hypothetical protein
MKQSIKCENRNDADGNPAGGFAVGEGIFINWQNGPLGRGPDRQQPNGAFVETVIEAAAQRIRYYQESRFACAHNAKALEHLEAALASLEARTAEREGRNVEGTHLE